MTEKETKCCCCNRKKERSEQEYKDLINRLSRIEGQIRGIKRMLDEDCYCPDIITQVAAANAALNSFNKVLLANHIKTCVADDIRAYWYNQAVKNIDFHPVKELGFIFMCMGIQLLFAAAIIVVALRITKAPDGFKKHTAAVAAHK